MNEKFPCDGCITLAICRAQVDSAPPSEKVYSVWILSKKCSILNNFIKPRIDSATNHERALSVLKFYKVNL